MLGILTSAILFVGLITAVAIITYDVFDQWVEDLVEKRLDYYGDLVIKCNAAVRSYQAKAIHWEAEADRYRTNWEMAESDLAHVKADLEWYKDHWGAAEAECRSLGLTLAKKNVELDNLIRERDSQVLDEYFDNQEE